jgi:hypothetical protein
LNIENLFLEEEIAFVIVQGDQQALNINNFQLLGEGVQNLMLAYQGLEEEDDIAPVAIGIQDQEMEENLSEGNVSDPNLEAFQFNDIVPPEVAHLQIAKVETHIFPEHEIQKFSKEGMELWEKYFAPHIQTSSDAAGEKVLEIPVSWFNFITLMLLTPKKFDWAKKFMNSAL